MADQYVQLAADGPGKKIDTSELQVGVNIVERQRIVVADPTDPTALARVTSANPNGWDFGMVTRALLFGDNPSLGPLMPQVLSDGSLKVAPWGFETLPFKSNNAATSVLNFPGPAQFHWLMLSNIHTAAVYVKLYDLPNAPVLASDIPFLTIPVATGGFLSLNFPGRGLDIVETLRIVITAGSADNDTTTVLANKLKGLIGG